MTNILGWVHGSHNTYELTNHMGMAAIRIRGQKILPHVHDHIALYEVSFVTVNYVESLASLISPDPTFTNSMLPYTLRLHSPP
jgi:hypothetical protein